MSHLLSPFPTSWSASLCSSHPSISTLSRDFFFQEWFARRKREKSITNTVYFDKKEDKATVSGEEDKDESDISSPASPEIPRAKRSLTKDCEFPGGVSS